MLTGTEEARASGLVLRLPTSLAKEPPCLGQDVVAHCVDEAGGIGQMRGRREREETPKVRKAEREAGHQLETATICSVALGLRSGWAGRPGDRVRSPARCPRPPG